MRKLITALTLILLCLQVADLLTCHLMVDLQTHQGQIRLTSSPTTDLTGEALLVPLALLDHLMALTEDSLLDLAEADLPDQLDTVLSQSTAADLLDLAAAVPQDPSVALQLLQWLL